MTAELSILMDLQSVSFVTGLTVTGQLGLEQWSNVLTEGGGTHLKLQLSPSVAKVDFTIDITSVVQCTYLV